MARTTSATVLERVTVLETESRFHAETVKLAAETAQAAKLGVAELTASFQALTSQLSQLREMLKLYLQIASMLATAALLALTGGPMAQVVGLMAKAAAHAFAKAF